MADITVMEKGATPIMISEKAPNLKNLLVGMGWDVNTSGGQDFDLDCSVVLTGEDKKLKDQNHLIYYGNLEFKKDGQSIVKHSADDLTGGTSEKGDDEFINIRLDKMPEDIQHVFVLVNIYDAAKRSQHFGLVSNSYFRLVDGDTEQEFARHDLKAEYTNHSGVMVADIYRMGDEWKAKILGDAIDGSIQDILKSYGLE